MSCVQAVVVVVAGSKITQAKEGEEIAKKCATRNQLSLTYFVSSGHILSYCSLLNECYFMQVDFYLIGQMCRMSLVEVSFGGDLDEEFGETCPSDRFIPAVTKVS